MVKGYSEDLRNRVLLYLEEGGKTGEAVRIFKVSAMSISRWRKRKKDCGHVKDKQQTRWARKINLEELSSYIQENPDKLLSEMGEHFDVSASTIHRNLKKLNIVYKKNAPIC